MGTIERMSLLENGVAPSASWPWPHGHDAESPDPPLQSLEPFLEAALLGPVALGDVGVGDVAAVLHGLLELGVLGEPVADGGEADLEQAGEVFVGGAQP